MKQKVLIVDDEKPICDLLETIFQSAGFETRAFLNGPSALQSLAEFCPDIVLTDGKMPEMNGAEFAAEVKERYPHLPIILVTGMIVSVKKRDCFDAIVTKPFRVHEIVTPVKLLLSGRERMDYRGFLDGGFSAMICAA